MQGRLISHTLLRTATMEHQNRRGERLDPQTTTLLSTLLPRTVIPRSLFIIPGLTLTCSHRQDGCTNGKIHIFTICYFSNGRQEQRGWVKLGKTTKAKLLRVECLNVMSTAEYQMATQMGVFPFLQHQSFITMTMVLYAQLLLSLWYCMHDYHYHYGIVCTIIIVTLLVCKTMILFLW
jgi:hypothetical protein